MKRKISFYLISILILYILPKPEYRELNSLGIVHSIHIQCIEEEYKIELEEIIPQKENNSIVFQYKKYRITEKEIQNTKKDLEKKYHKKFYYKGMKNFTTNCDQKTDILSYFKKNKISK